jgi:hypothetical protein
MEPYTSDIEMSYSDEESSAASQYQDGFEDSDEDPDQTIRGLPQSAQSIKNLQEALSGYKQRLNQFNQTPQLADLNRLAAIYNTAKANINQHDAKEVRSLSATQTGLMKLYNEFLNEFFINVQKLKSTIEAARSQQKPLDKELYNKAAQFNRYYTTLLPQIHNPERTLMRNIKSDLETINRTLSSN